MIKLVKHDISCWQCKLNFKLFLRGRVIPKMMSPHSSQRDFYDYTRITCQLKTF